MDKTTQTLSLPQALQLAMQHHQAGKLAEAGAIYKQILQLVPDHGDALHYSGVLAYQSGKSDQAIDLITKAIEVDPSNPVYYNNIGPVYRALYRYDEALAAYKQALTLAPENADTHNNLANLYRQMGRLEDAVRSYETACQLKPNEPVFIYNLGCVLLEQNKLELASERFQKALTLKPNYAEAHNDLGKVRRLQGRMGEASACFEKAIELKPDFAMAHNNLASVLKVHGRSEEAVASYRRALECDPAYADAYSNMLFAMQYANILTSQELFAEHLRFAERFETPLKLTWQAHLNNRDPERRLKVGYLSPDFRHHAVAYFIEPVLAQHDKSQVEVFCYYNSTDHDNFTDRIQAVADHWVPCKALSDDQLAERIRNDGIDILIDMVGHTAGNRLLVFARKPAPIQVTWLGYFSTTGLAAMDYRFTDAYMDPPGFADSIHTEKLVRLPNFSPFQPAEGSPPVNRLPALSGKPFMFASMNNLAKLNREVIRLWADILKQVPNSRLSLCNLGDDETKRILLEMFAKEDIGSERLVLQPWMPILDYLALHQQIDLALDPFPYNGGTITNHSLWMGVPVVTLEGDRPVGRIGASLMRRAGLPQFVAKSREEYLACAVRMTQELQQLDHIRQSLRANITSNPDASAEQMTRSVETAYREMWRHWCGKTAS